MTARLILAWSALALATACSGGSDCVDAACDTDPDTDRVAVPADGSGDTGRVIVDPDAQLLAMFVSAQFGYDGAGVVQASFDGNVIEPFINLSLITELFQGDPADTENYCSIQFPLTNSLFRTEVLTDTRLTWGVNWNPKEPFVTTCNLPGNLQVDAATFGTTGPLDFFTQNGDGSPANQFVALGFLGLRPEVKQQVTLDEFDLGCALGLPAGRFSVGGSVATQIDDCVANAWALDEAGVIVDEVKSRIPATDAYDAGSIANPAYFELSSLIYWAFQQ